ncbi:MAG: protein translocase subunit SecF [Candidatus Taylorbacteria bacterium]
MFIVKYRKIFYTISGLLVLASIVLLFSWGLTLGVDFKGGTILEVEYRENRPSVDEIHTALAPMSLNENIRPTGDKGYIMRMKTIEEKEHVSIIKTLSFGNTKPFIEKRFNTIGPLLGREAANKALVSIVFVLLCIVLFITFAFRKVSEPVRPDDTVGRVSSWKYGIIAILALFHDVAIPTGVFVVLGHFLGYEVDTLFVTALLVVLGFSIHDTIVVFDRVRENLRLNHEHKQKKAFETVVGESISQTFTRSINTSLTTLLALIVLYFVGAEVTQHFSLVLIVGIAVGTYSSIFLGSPLLVTVERWQNRKNK